MRGPAEKSPPAPIDAAIKTFVHGFSFTRSFTHPYLIERIGPVWRIHDAPRTSGHLRNEEFVAARVAPDELNAIARRTARWRFAICVIVPDGDDPEELKTAYKALGYRLTTTEPFMVHDLKRIPTFTSPAQIERVTTQELADRLNKTAQTRQILPAHLLPGAPMRQYAAIVNETIAGWVRSIHVGTSTWCSNMYVLPAFRRRGIGKAMLSALLRDDRAAGAKSAVLLASHTGALLYPHVGYRQIGKLFLFCPKRPPRKALLIVKL